MRKLKSCLWYVLMRILILLKDIWYLVKAIGLLIFCWIYPIDDLDKITHDMDVTDRKWTRFGR